MKKHGFTTINDEWWHYTDKNWTKYPILNVPLPPLNKRIE